LIVVIALVLGPFVAFVIVTVPVELEADQVTPAPPYALITEAI
jgi:hypothetical protein